MKILQINALYGEKSTGTIVRDIAEKLMESHESPSTICMQSSIKDADIITTGITISSKLHAFLTRLIGYQGCWSYCMTLSLLSRIKKIDPDIVHIHNLHSNFINLPLLLKYCSKYDKPLIVTLHDCWYFTGKCYHFEDAKCDKWLTGCGNCPKKRMDIPSLFWDSSRATFKIKQKAFNTVQKLYVVGCSKWITEKAKLSPIFSNAKFLTIHNGVDTSIFYQTFKIRENNKPFTILAMANKWFLPENTVLRDKLKKIAGPEVRFRIIGCTTLQLRNNHSNQYIQYLGYTNNRIELSQYYREADVFLNVTFIDTLPTVNMEAICCGTPVITYDSGGSPELVSEGETGYVVTQNDIDGVLTAIQRVKNGLIDRDLCATVGQQKFDKNVNYHKYIKLYRQILS